MKPGLAIMLICAMGYGQVSMADCGDEDAASTMEKSVAPAPALTDATQAAAQIVVPQIQEARTRPAGTHWRTMRARRSVLYTPGEEAGYKP